MRPKSDTTCAALFDFDKTITSKDTGLAFILYALNRNTLRQLTVILLSPIAILFFISNRSRFIGNSFFLWIATCGLSNRKIIALRRQFISDYLQRSDVIIYREAVLKISEHQKK